MEAVELFGLVTGYRVPKVHQAAGKIGMFRSEHLLLNAYDALEHRPRTSGIVRPGMDDCEVVQRLGDQRVVGAEKLFADGKGPLPELARLGVVALLEGDSSEAVERIGDAGTFRCQFLADGQRQFQLALGGWTEKSNASVLVPIRTNLECAATKNQGLGSRTHLPIGVCEEYLDLPLRGNRDTVIECS
jgi:hypothetical protein